MTDHLDLHNEGKATTETLRSQRQNVLRQKKLQQADLIADFCFISGACPCVAPCGWGLLAQDAVRRDGWPDPGQCRLDRR